MNHLTIKTELTENKRKKSNSQLPNRNGTHIQKTCMGMVTNPCFDALFICLFHRSSLFYCSFCWVVYRVFMVRYSKDWVVYRNRRRRKKKIQKTHTMNETFTWRHISTRFHKYSTPIPNSWRNERPKKKKSKFEIW